MRRLFFAAALFLFAATARGAGVVNTVVNDAAAATRVARRITATPFHGSVKDYVTVAGVAASIAALSSFDRSMRATMRDRNEPWAETVADVGHAYARTRMTFYAAGVLYASGLVFDNPDVRRTGVEVIEAFCLSAVGSQLVKHTLGRDRPVAENGPFNFVGLNSGDIHQSFPSGDATVAFTLSSVLSAEAKSPPVTIALFTLAGATAFQRMQRDRHWFSDTVAGAVWGTAAGWGVVRVNRSPYSPANRITVAPSAQGAGFTVHFR